MRPLHLNLSSQPFRDYRPVYAVVAVASVLIAFLMINNVQTFFRYVTETRNTRDEIARIEAQTVRERQRAEVAAQQIASIDTAALAAETHYVNAMLAERAFSWSELLDRLEEVIPPDVRIINIAPSFTKTGDVQLSLSCHAKSSDGMLTTLARLQRSRYFAGPFPSSETQEGSGFTFGISVAYKPSVSRSIESLPQAVRR